MTVVSYEREIYPNAPVALVAVEARHTAAPAFTPEQESELKALLASEFPLSQPVPTLSFNFGTMGAAAPASPVVAPPRFTNRDRTTAVTFGPQAVTIETTHHEHFGYLSELVVLASSARQKVAPVDGIERLGIRYIDEIRVPSDDTVVDWSQWVESSLLGPVDVGARLGLPMVEHQSLTSFQLAPNKGLNVRYGPRVGYAVQPGLLVRPTPSVAAFFLLDIDSFWTAIEEIPEFDPDRILVLCTELHDSISSLFENLITERLREEVLRHA
jgi:uncharacterized protein (TIGR04255 family)